MVRLVVDYTADNTVLCAHDAIQSLNIVAHIQQSLYIHPTDPCK